MNTIAMDFVNTLWYIKHKIFKDILLDDALLNDFFAERGIVINKVDKLKDTSKLLDLRNTLYECLDEIVENGVLSSKHIDTLNCYLSLSTGIRKIEPFKDDSRSSSLGINLSFSPLASNLEAALAEIAASFVDFISECDISRLKKCKNPECNWFFYDETKSRTKIWCNDNCANLMKVRKFRARKKAENKE